MAKYVNVHLEVDKLIKIDSDTNYFDEALEVFSDYETTSEYLEDRNVFVNENTDIIQIAKKMSEQLYEKYQDYLSYDIVKEQIENIFEESDYSEYVLEETIEVLKNDYDINLKTIHI